MYFLTKAGLFTGYRILPEKNMIAPGPLKIFCRIPSLQANFFRP